MVKPDWWKDLVVAPAIPGKTPVPEDLELPFVADPRGERVRRDDWLLNPDTVVRYDDALIGPAGQPGITVSPGRGGADGGRVVEVHRAAGLPAGSAVVVQDESLFARSGLRVSEGGLNIVSGAGFNVALGKTVKDLNRSGFGVGEFGAGTIGR